MSQLDLLEFACFIDRFRKASAPQRERVVVRDFAGGWLSVRPGEEVGENPSATTQRVYWVTRTTPLTRADVDAAVCVLRELRCRGAYFNLSPWACDAGVEKMLAEAGAKEWPYVEYVGLARRTGPVPLDRKSDMTVRQVTADEVAGVVDAVRPWGSLEYGATAARQVREIGVCAYAAFCGEKPAAIGLLTVWGDFGYLGAAWTAEGFRGRGAQTALIAARVERAAELGASWAAVETNTVAAASLRNLVRTGFTPVIRWRMFRWDDPYPAA